MQKFSRLSGKQIAFYVGVFGKELIFCSIVCILLFFMRDTVLKVECFNYINSGAFIESINNFNIGLIFAMFLAIFVSDTSVSIRDARNHPAYRQPLVIVIVNSFLLCCLSSIKSPSTRWIELSIISCSLPLLFSNIRRMWELIGISWSSTDVSRDKKENN